MIGLQAQIAGAGDPARYRDDRSIDLHPREIVDADHQMQVTISNVKATYASLPFSSPTGLTIPYSYSLPYSSPE